MRCGGCDSPICESPSRTRSTGENRRPAPRTNGWPGRGTRSPSHSRSPLPRVPSQQAARRGGLPLDPACLSGPSLRVGRKGSSWCLLLFAFSRTHSRAVAARGRGLGELEQAPCQHPMWSRSFGKLTLIVRNPDKSGRLSRSANRSARPDSVRNPARPAGVQNTLAMRLSGPATTGMDLEAGARFRSPARRADEAVVRSLRCPNS